MRSFLSPKADTLLSRYRRIHRAVVAGAGCLTMVLLSAIGGRAAPVAVDLGPLGGSFSVATAVNANGQVIGFSYLAGDMTQHAFSWAFPGPMVDLTLGGSYSEATAVNVNGQVVGYSNLPGDMAQHAFLRTAAGLTPVDLGTLGGTSSVATAVNAN